jgi:hypothetical protein
MPYQISWHNPSTMLIELIGEVSSDDILSMTNESFVLVEAATEKIDAIIDQSKVITMPRSLNALIQSIPRNRHANQGTTILLIPKINQLGRFAASTLLQVLGLDYRIVQNMEEAETILKKRRIHS